MRDLIKYDWCISILAVSLSLFAPSAVHCRTALLLLCFLIVGIHASGISTGNLAFMRQLMHQSHLRKLSWL